MDVNPLCLLCRKKPETTTHIFWECKRVRRLWANLLPISNNICLDDRSGWAPADYCEAFWRLERDGRLIEDRVAKFLVICWQIWTHRNVVFHNKAQTNIQILEHKITNYFSEFLRSKVSNLRTNPEARFSQVVVMQHSPRWIPPPVDMLKLNCDAAWCEKQSRGGIGWVLRQSNGAPICAGYKSIQKSWKVTWLEAMAVSEGLKNIPHVSLPIRVETDSLIVVQLLTGEDHEATELSNFIEEASFLMASLPIDEVAHISRCHNELAHKLAQKACFSNSSECWLDNFPDWFCEFNSLDTGFATHTCGGACPTGIGELFPSFFNICRCFKKKKMMK